jgi:hypothetical protein
MVGDAQPEVAERKPRRARRQYWDDLAFRKRVTALAEARGQTVREAMLGAGLAVDYVSKPQSSRGINQLMTIAKYFDVPISVILGTEEAEACPPKLVQGDDVPVGAPVEAVISEKALRAVLHHAERWLFLALLLNRPDTDPQMVASALRMDMEELVS